ncbi:MAG: type II secretion system protein GspF [Deltaproteobacteria bacterium RIFCSPHIGHO2_02_FULL_40_11]|nr:MAG: type II secretion system protein GspF [Deltaproteobacteria bacterium RIFCSPHIGHO2_02_FULL_40_11]
MPLFEYKGLDQSGKNVKGRIDGDNQKVARAKLRKQGIFPTQLTEKKVTDKAGSGINLKAFFQRITVNEIAIMTRQLATLSKAHIPLVDALVAITDQIENEKLKLIMTDVKEQVNEGASFAQALEKHPQVFSNLFVNMVKAGESSGTLDSVLLRLADFTEASVKLKNKVVGSMTYPILMMVVGTAIVSGLFIFVIPKITAIFSDMERALPLITQIVIKISDLLRTQWYLIITGLLAIVYFTRKFLKTNKGKQLFDKWILKVPVLGRLVRILAISRFAQTLSTLLQGGVPLLSAMDIVKNVVDNTTIQRAIIEARNNISEGESLAAPLKESGHFPPMVTHMIAIGEKSGELENMLNTIAETYEEELNTTLSAMTQLLEPLMIVVMGAVVGVIVMAILLPILDLNNISG